MANEISVPDRASAPAFHDLTELQQKFVLALLRYGSGKGQRTRAAKIAGYAGDDNTLHVCAHLQFHNPKVQKAMHEIAAAHLGSFQLFAIDGIASLAESARDEGVKLKALLALADRSGFGTVQKIDVRHEDVNRSEEQKIEQMVAIVMRRPELLQQIPEPRRSLIEAKVAERKGEKPPEIIDVPHKEITTVEDDPSMDQDPDAELFGE